MEIDIDTLEQACQAIFVYLKEAKIDSIQVEQDFYWHISQEDRYNPYQEPKNLTLGQLSSDWEEIKKIAVGESEPLGYSFVLLSSLLKYLGENQPS